MLPTLGAPPPTTQDPASHQLRLSLTHVFASLIRLLGWGYIPIAVIAKLPFAMSVVAVMTAVSALRGSY